MTCFISLHILIPSAGVTNSESVAKVTLPGTQTKKKKVYIVRKRATADATIPVAEPVPSRKRRSQEGAVAALKVQKSSSDQSTGTKSELM